MAWSVAACLVIGIFLLLGLSPERWVDTPGRKASTIRWRGSVALATTAVAFVSTALAIGPLRVLRGGQPVVHDPWRRTVGVTGAVLAAAHLVVALSIHGSLRRPWEQFVHDRPTVSDPIVVLRGARGYANWIGLVVALLLVLLVVISRTSWLRRLGRHRWKAAQRLVYLVYPAILLHAVLYWRVERRLVGHRILVLVPITGVMGLQAWAATTMVVRKRNTAD